MSADLRTLAETLKPHGWQENDPILAEHGGLMRYVSLRGQTRTQWIDGLRDGRVSVWGAGLGDRAKVVMRAEDVVPYLREMGVM